MTRERFGEILREYGFSERQIELLWQTRPTDDLDEARLRRTSAAIQPEKDDLVQE